MANPSFIFLPDISGFTEFIKDTEVSHSKHIIAELLELLIDANELDMTLAEIEGDALFFYKHESLPSKQAILRQVENMFIKFHNHLQLYDKQRICQCGACTSALNLNLKFIAHAGEMDFIQIKDHKKPYGENIIVAHRLMKNNIKIDEYALLSNGLLANWEEDNTIVLKENLAPIKDSYQYDLGVVDYEYLELTPLLKFVESPKALPPGPKINKPISIKKFIKKPIQELFELVSNFDYRLSWNTEINGMEYEKGKINRVGTKHNCIINKDTIKFETTKGDFGQRLAFGERSQDFPIADEIATYFIFDSKDEGTELSIEAHPIVKNPIKKLILPIMKLKLNQILKQHINDIKLAAEK